MAHEATFLPLFPLELVVFPGEDLRLHIFEPRYKQLIQECQRDQVTFGINLLTKHELADYGTEMQLVEVYRVYSNGEMDIMVRGVRPYRLERFIQHVPDRLYSGGDVVFLTDREGEPATDAEELAREYARLLVVLGVRATPPDAEEPIAPPLSYRIAQEAGLSMTEKVRLLSLQSESERQSFLIEHLRRVIPVIEAAEAAKKHSGGNGVLKHDAETAS